MKSFPHYSVLFIFAALPLTPRARALESRVELGIGRSSIQCIYLEDYRTVQCNLYIRGDEPVRKQFPELNALMSLSFQTQSTSWRNQAEMLLVTAQQTGGKLAGLLSRSAFTELGAVSYVEFTLQPDAAPNLLFSGRVYENLPKPIVFPCTSDCCNSWCGPGGF